MDIHHFSSHNFTSLNKSASIQQKAELSDLALYSDDQRELYDPVVDPDGLQDCTWFYGDHSRDTESRSSFNCSPEFIHEAGCDAEESGSAIEGPPRLKAADCTPSAAQDFPGPDARGGWSAAGGGWAMEPGDDPFRADWPHW